MTSHARVRILACVSFLLGAPHAAVAVTTSLTLVQAYTACTDPNAVLPNTSLGGLACTPPVTESSYRMVTPGKLSLLLSSSSLGVSVSLPRVEEAPGTPVGLVAPFRDVALSARVRVRTTDGACVGGAGCTVVDRTINVPVICKITTGRCSGKSSIGVGRSAGGRSVALVAIEVFDDLGNVLAVPGL